MKLFEWDEQKNLINRQKHGIDFVAATAVYDDPNRLEMDCTQSGQGEIRTKTIGQMDGLFIVAVVSTDRAQRIRLISARLASKNERKHYAMRQQGNPAQPRGSNMPITVERTNGAVMQLMADGSKRAIEDSTDWARLKAMTEQNIDAAAQADIDNPPLTDEELKTLRPVPNPKEIRKRLKMTQQQFATRFELPLGTLRDWEQHVREPDSAAKSYLRVIAKNPEAVLQALADPL
ncbi:MAG: BrnT family toxin [Methylovulum sp.]|uniref:BrnT family toxin n=1 Tax=Methylovulum sp. TaxID=1916980 RepID=UPI0026044432|nr:BrnT family toxin [Methylovulum sp.]MDD2724994.1 BrnT family toxin [Methylovulum sp.]MDD5125595.1 BrnT family toxin [Methylovulum sp.]